MTFQEVSKNYLSILMALLFKDFFLLSLSVDFPVIFTLNGSDLESAIL